MSFCQCCGSKSGSGLDSGFNGLPGSGSRKEKMTLNNRKKYNFYNAAGCSLLMAEGFSCCMDFLYDGLGINCKVNWSFWSAVFIIFGHQNPGSGSGLDESGSTTLHCALVFPRLRTGICRVSRLSICKLLRTGRCINYVRYLIFNVQTLFCFFPFDSDSQQFISFCYLLYIVPVCSYLKLSTIYGTELKFLFKFKFGSGSWSDTR